MREEHDFPVSAGPASEPHGLLFFPFSIHSTLSSAYCVLGYHHKLQMVPVSKELTTLRGKKQVRNRRLVFIQQQVRIVCLLFIRLCWTWGMLVKKRAEIAAVIDPLLYKEGTMNNKQIKKYTINCFRR